MMPCRSPRPRPSPATSASTRSTPSRWSWPSRVSLFSFPLYRSPVEVPAGRHADPSRGIGSNFTEEFAIEIPDEDADRITTVGEGESHFLHTWFTGPPPMPASADTFVVISLAAIDYISKSPEAH
jgi:hypothetical protein